MRIFQDCEPGLLEALVLKLKLQVNIVYHLRIFYEENSNIFFSFFFLFYSFFSSLYWCFEKCFSSVRYIWMDEVKARMKKKRKNKRNFPWKSIKLLFVYVICLWVSDCVLARINAYNSCIYCRTMIIVISQCSVSNIVSEVKTFASFNSRSLCLSLFIVFVLSFSFLFHLLQLVSSFSSFRLLSNSNPFVEFGFQVFVCWWLKLLECDWFYHIQ